MANENDIQLHLKTTGDTKGAEEVEKAVDEVKASTAALTDEEKKRIAIKQQQRRLAEEEKKLIEEHGRLMHEGMPGITYAIDENAKALGLNAAAWEEVTEETREALEAAKEQTREAQRLQDEQDRLNEQKREAIRLEEQHAQRIADVEEAQKRVAEREANATGGGANPTLATGRESAAATAAGMAAVAAAGKLAMDAIGETLNRFKALRTEMDGSEADLGAWSEALLETVEFISSPFEKIKEGIKGIAGLDDLEEAIERTKETKKWYDSLVEARKKFAAAAQDEATARSLRNELNAIDAQSAAFERQLGILRSRRELLEAKAQAADQTALANGADPSLVAVQQIIRQTQERNASFDEELARFGEAIASADAARTAAINKLSALQSSGASQEAIEAARIEVEQVENDLSESIKDLEAARERVSNQKETSATQARAAIEAELEETKERFQGLSEGIAATVTENAKDVIAASDKAQKEAEAAGKTVSGNQKLFHEALRKLIEDQTPDTQQIELIKQATLALGRAIETKDNEMITGINKITANQLSQAQLYQQTLQRLADVQKQIEAINSRLR